MKNANINKSRHQLTIKKRILIMRHNKFFCGNRAVYDCLLHDGLVPVHVGFHAYTGYHHGRI